MPARSKLKADSAANLEEQIRDHRNARDLKDTGLKVAELLELSPNDGEGVSWKQQADREIANERVSANQDSLINSMKIGAIHHPVRGEGFTSKTRRLEESLSTDVRLPVS